MIPNLPLLTFLERREKEKKSWKTKNYLHWETRKNGAINMGKFGTLTKKA